MSATRGLDAMFYFYSFCQALYKNDYAGFQQYTLFHVGVTVKVQFVGGLRFQDRG